MRFPIKGVKYVTPFHFTSSLSDIFKDLRRSLVYPVRAPMVRVYRVHRVQATVQHHGALRKRR